MRLGSTPSVWLLICVGVSPTAAGGGGEVLAPEPSGGGVAINDMDGPLGGADRVRPPGRARDHHVGIELPQRTEPERIEREQRAEAPVYRQPVEGRGAHIPASEAREGRLGPIQRRVDRRMGPHVRHLQHHPLRPAALVEVVVRDRDVSELVLSLTVGPRMAEAATKLPSQGADVKFRDCGLARRATTQWIDRPHAAAWGLLMVEV